MSDVLHPEAIQVDTFIRQAGETIATVAATQFPGVHTLVLAFDGRGGFTWASSASEEKLVEAMRSWVQQMTPKGRIQV